MATDAGDRIEIGQTARETLIISPLAQASLLIQQQSGAHLSLRSDIQSLTLSERTTETLIIHEPGGDSMMISEAGGVLSPYGRPYTHADDGSYYYYAWQHSDGTRWKAQRFELASLALITITGDNPQPVSLTDFQTLSF